MKKTYSAFVFLVLMSGIPLAASGSDHDVSYAISGTTRDMIAEEWYLRHHRVVTGSSAYCKNGLIELSARGAGELLEKYLAGRVFDYVLEYTGSRIAGLAATQFLPDIGGPLSDWASWTCWCKPRKYTDYTFIYDADGNPIETVVTQRSISCCTQTSVGFGIPSNATCSRPYDSVVQCMEESFNGMNTCYKIKL